MARLRLPRQMRKKIMISNKSSRKSVGFTLIEVIIALVILAIALLAVIKTTNASINNATRLRERLVSHWVALDTLAGVQLKMVPMPTGSNPTQGTADLFQQTWHWSVARAGSSFGRFIPVIITVKKNKQQYAQLTGYVDVS